MLEQLTLLLSFIYALAITHLLSSVADLIQARARVRISALHLLWMLIALILLCLSWLQLWPLHGVAHWSLGAIATQFVVALLQYFTCSLVAVKIERNERVDMVQVFDNERPAIFSAFGLRGIFGMLGNYIQRSDSFWWRPAIFILPGFLLVLVGALARPLWLQWTVGLATLCLLLVWCISFSHIG